MEMNNLIEIAKWLGKERDAILLDRLEELYSNGKFYITVWGHYSAGKSKLINNILGRDILPVKTRETTAVLTYIQYGQNDECVITYDDGKVKSYDIEKIKRIFQDTDENDIDLSLISHIDVYLDSEVLKNGITIVDTPGVNTIIQKHQSLAIDAIEQSGRIIYVLGGSPSDVDRKFIKKIKECGIDITFVRTKCDSFISTEEDADISLEQEKESLKEIVEDEVVFIPVSNEKESNWYSYIDLVRDRLNDIAESMSSEMPKAKEERMKVFAKQYKTELEGEEKRLQDIISGNTTEIEKELEKCNKEIESLTTLSDNLEEKVENKVKEANTDARNEVDKYLTKSKEKFVSCLDDIGYSQNVAEQISDVYDRCLDDSIREIQNIMDSNYGKIIDNEQDAVNDMVESLCIPQNRPTYTEVQQENSRALSMYRTKLQELKESVENIYQEKENISGKLAEQDFDEDKYRAILESLDEELYNIPTDIPLKISEQQDIQPSQVFKKIGQAADLALYLLPGEVIAKGVETFANAGKVANIIQKNSKGTQFILKSMGVIKDNANAIDKMRDIGYTVGKVFKMPGKYERQAKKTINKVAEKAGNLYEDYKRGKESSSVFDFLSVEYWAEKIGENFDKPLNKEIDKEVENERNNKRNEILREKEKTSKEILKKRKELGLLKTKEEELEFTIKEKIRIQKEVEKEIDNMQRSIQENACRKGLEKYKMEYKNYFSNNISKVAKEIADGYFNTACQNITMYLSMNNTDVCNAIEEKKEQLNLLLEKKKDGNLDGEQRLQQCKQYMAEIQEVL